jgi:hypothetical protein
VWTLEPVCHRSFTLGFTGNRIYPPKSSGVSLPVEDLAQTMSEHDLENPLVIMTVAGIPYTVTNRLSILVGSRMVVIKDGSGKLFYVPLKNISHVVEQ